MKRFINKLKQLMCKHGKTKTVYIPVIIKKTVCTKCGREVKNVS